MDAGERGVSTEGDVEGEEFLVGARVWRCFAVCTGSNLPSQRRERRERLEGDPQHQALVPLHSGPFKLTGKSDFRVPESVLYIVVNAQASGARDWDTQPTLPSLRRVLSTISGTEIYRYNFETLELLRQSATEWEKQAEKHDVFLKTAVVGVAFDNLAGTSERNVFNDVATTWDLDGSRRRDR